MAQIIKFRSKRQDIKRTEALIKGTIVCYTCDDCGAEIEVIDDEFPRYCPECGTEILEWDNSEDDT